MGCYIVAPIALQKSCKKAKEMRERSNLDNELQKGTNQENPAVQLQIIGETLLDIRDLLWNIQEMFKPFCTSSLQKVKQNEQPQQKS